jgi:hypothetical protein
MLLIRGECRRSTVESVSGSSTTHGRTTSFSSRRGELDGGASIGEGLEFFRLDQRAVQVEDHDTIPASFASPLSTPVPR